MNKFVYYSACAMFGLILSCTDINNAWASSNFAKQPNSDINSGLRHSYGPDAENNKSIPMGSMVDAYGNPILPEEEKKAPRQRLRSGAYGGANPQQSRPLPDSPETDAGWGFK